MNQISQNINGNAGVLLAINTPVALVVGAGSFFGSHLVDKLLAKNIQVIGVDNLTSGKKQNLVEASENKNFHLIIDPTESPDLKLERLDYILLIPKPDLHYKKTFDLFKQLKSRLLLISSIDLYDQASANLGWLKRVEAEVARIAKEENLNARILRLGAVFGPRMSFDCEDPMIRLIQQSLSGGLHKDTSLQFSSRAIFVDDAASLAIKCIFAGSTAQKIFDAVSPTPVKIAEIKQVLLDPIWYENKQFIPSELPPWPTPNLEQTTKVLNWQPTTKLVAGLRQTLSYFKDHEIKVPELEAGKEENEKWQMEKAGELEEFKKEIVTVEKTEQVKKGIFPSVTFWLGLLMIIYALVWPVVELSWGVLTFRHQLFSAINSLEKGEFDKSLLSVRAAKSGVIQAKGIFYSLEPVRQMGLLKSQFELGDRLATLATLSSDAAQETTLGVQNLYKSLKSITGELNESPAVYFDSAKTYLASADEDLSKAQALINREDFKSQLPNILKFRVMSLSERLSLYSNLVKKARALSYILPGVVAREGSKNYLILLQNNAELRPTGGFIGSFAKVQFEGGKLKKLEVNDIYAIDGQLKIHVEPPKEILKDLGQKDFYLRDSNWEPDFPTAARQAEWFYTKETGERAEGVVALDISAIEDLLKVVGSLDLADYNQTVTAENLFEKALSMSEINFFPGTQAKKSFLTSLTASLFNKLFFLPNQNWPAVVTSLGKSLKEKHMSIYLDNPRLFSYVVSQNWASLLPRAAEGDLTDFLAPVEANLGANKANYYLDRKLNLETTIGKDGGVSHKLRVAYTNRSPSDAFPAGKYKNRMRIYLPFGTKLNKAVWGESDISKDVSSFVDYGRSGYSFLIELLPKEQKTLVLDYTTSLKLSFVDDKATYRLDIVKQAGTLKDPFVWSVAYPINLRLTSDQAQKIGPQEQTIQTDLSTDKIFKLEFRRNL